MHNLDLLCSKPQQLFPINTVECQIGQAYSNITPPSQSWLNHFSTVCISNRLHLESGRPWFCAMSVIVLHLNHDFFYGWFWRCDQLKFWPKIMYKPFNNEKNCLLVLTYWTCQFGEVFMNEQLAIFCYKISLNSQIFEDDTLCPK